MMQLKPTEVAPHEIEADVVVVGVFAESKPEGPAGLLDEATGGAISRLIESTDVSGQLATTTSLLAPNGVAANQILIVGLGARDKFNRQAAFRSAGAAAKALATRERSKVAYYLSDGWSKEETSAGVCGAIVGCYGQDLYRAKKKMFAPSEVLWAGSDDEAIETGKTLGEGVNLTRRLVNEPAGFIYPETFADLAVETGNQAGFSTEVWDEDKLSAERCNSLLGVAQGSDRPARLVIMRHEGAGKDAPTLALVGKGVTFDSGGYSLKPSDGMKAMKCDMAGAATVLGAMQAIAALNLPVNVIGLVGLVENLVSGNAYKLGDVLTARNGKTIEVLNTDAEGRLVLADVLCVANDLQVAKIIDLATLTGACLVALGMDIAGLMTNNQEWVDQVKSAAETCGERAWQLPMDPEFGEQIQSQVADIKNIGEGRWGGTITAAKFLEEFVDDTPWVHIDIAGPAFPEKPKPWLDAGGSGAFVQTLVEIARNWK